MHIAIFGLRGIPSGYSGYEGFIEELATRLIPRGHTITVYAHKYLFKERPKQYKGINLVYIPAVQGKNTAQLSHSFLCAWHVVFSKADVVLVCNCANGYFGAILRAFGKPCCINVDGLEWLRPKWGRMGKRMFKWGAECAVKFFNIIITDAKGMQDYYRENFKCESVDIAYGGKIEYSTNPELVKKLGLEPNRYYLIASRLVADNNADLIVKGFVQSGSKKILAIAGGTVYKNPFEDYVRSLANDRVKFLGHIDDQDVIKELHCNAFAYCHGHQFGGTNPALLKALAYGNLIFAMDTVFSREVLDDGKYGILISKDPAKWAEQINYFEANETLAQPYRDKSRDRVNERYTWEHITDEYEDVFKKLYALKHL